MLFTLALLFSVLLSSGRSQSCSSCSGAGCCCKDYTHDDQGDGLAGYINCPCMAAAPAPTLDTYLTMSCDPGLGCMPWCEWRTPLGRCWSTNEGSSWGCDQSVTGVRFLNTRGRCDIEVLVSSQHLGNWTCLTRPYTGNIN